MADAVRSESPRRPISERLREVSRGCTCAPSAGARLIESRGGICSKPPQTERRCRNILRREADDVRIGKRAGLGKRPRTISQQYSLANTQSAGAQWKRSEGAIVSRRGNNRVSSPTQSERRSNLCANHPLD